MFNNYKNANANYIKVFEYTENNGNRYPLLQLNIVSICIHVYLANKEMHIKRSETCLKGS